MAERIERLKQQGVSEAALARIHAPIGLAIGAVSPAEIAVAIMARDHRAPAHAEGRDGRAGEGTGMKFGAMKPSDAIGGVTVHSIRQNGLVLKKGTLIGAAEVEALAKAGVDEIVVAQLEAGDISEDEAAASIAQAIGGEGVTVERAFTGRSNLFAAHARRAGRRPRRRSTASIASMRRSRLRRWRTSSRWSKAR